MLPNWIFQQSNIQPDRPALVFAERTWTFAEAQAESLLWSRKLASFGVTKNSRVALLIGNTPNYIFLIQALTKLEAIAVLLNTRLTSKEILWQLEDSSADLLLHGHDYSESAVFAAEQLERQIPYLNIDTESSSLSITNLDFSEEIDLEAVQAIIYTSGTTGKPKGVQLTYGNHFYSATASAFNLGIEPQRDRWLLCLPLFHVGGLSIVWRSSIYGTPIVLQSKFDPETAIVSLSKQKVTLISLVPTMLKRILDNENFLSSLSSWQSLRCILLGGAALHQDLMQKCIELELPIAPSYGLTETASQATVLLPSKVKHKPNSVGKTLQCDHLRIVDMSDRSKNIPAGEIGQIAIKGANVAQGYLNTLNSETIQSGWLYTGDLGYLDSENYLYIVCRRTDLIISGGENIYPLEVEAILLAHPQIEEACVVGLPDREWGQIVAAAIVAKSKLSLENVRDFCRQQQLARFKLPKALYLMEFLPKTASGKLSRNLIQSQIS